jgi:RING finger/CHY zinc finger protein 1
MENFLENMQNMNITLLQSVINNVVFSNNIHSTETLNDYIKKDQETSYVYGCKHYLRRCKIVSPCCNEIFPCRLCHDEIKYDNIIDDKLKHKIDRFKISEVVCNNCNTKQSVKQYCENCNTCLGLYYCDICHLFDDIDKEQYHCDKCGFCRIGKGKFEHCDKCGICVNKDSSVHKCVDVVESLCPICMEDMFRSVKGIIQMKCGHYIHKKCFDEMLEMTYKCPMCSCSVINTEGINKYFDTEISLTPMPEEYKDYKVKILCNDCHKENEVKFHVVALKCLDCGGYNTRKL